MSCLNVNRSFTRQQEYALKLIEQGTTPANLSAFTANQAAVVRDIARGSVASLNVSVGLFTRPQEDVLRCIAQGVPRPAPPRPG